MLSFLAGGVLGYASASAALGTEEPERPDLSYVGVFRRVTADEIARATYVGWQPATSSLAAAPSTVMTVGAIEGSSQERSSAHSQILEFKDVQNFSVTETRRGGVVSLHISGLAFHSAFAVDRIETITLEEGFGPRWDATKRELDLLNALAKQRLFDRLRKER